MAATRTPPVETTKYRDRGQAVKRFHDVQHMRRAQALVALHSAHEEGAWIDELGMSPHVVCYLRGAAKGRGGHVLHVRAVLDEHHELGIMPSTECLHVCQQGTLR